MASLTREQHASLVREALDHLDDLPSHLVGGLRRYLELGMPTGSFLQAVLDNDLREAVARVSGDDLDAGETLRALNRWLYTHAPAACWGSKEKRLKWQQRVSLLLQEGRADV